MSETGGKPLNSPNSRSGDNQKFGQETQTCDVTNLHVMVVETRSGRKLEGVDVTVTGRGTKPTDELGWAKWDGIAPGT